MVLSYYPLGFDNSSYRDYIIANPGWYMKTYISETRTEKVILDLLDIQGWNINTPPKGEVIRENEYKSFPNLVEIFTGQSKKGKGDAYPDFLIVSKDMLPLVVIEAKADESDLSQAVKDAIHYATSCLEKGHEVLAIGIAGQEKTRVEISVKKHFEDGWKAITYLDNPIKWIPTPDDVIKILPASSSFDLSPVVPRPEILQKKAELLNRILREAHIKDEYRPAYIGAIILALWRSKGKIRRDPEYVLRDINASCVDSFVNAGKPELAKSLYVDEANELLASSAWRIIAELEKLNVVTNSFDHDYLGQLYEAFFRYTGGNTIGQYFTPRHITKFMADVCQTTVKSIVIDPACGTGGFLIACIQRALETTKLNYHDVVNMVKNNLIGYESEPITAALCVANMILRGDGKTGVRKDNSFTASDFPRDYCNVALMNPPFPHKKTDTPPQMFIERALEALQTNGKLGTIIPTSFLAKKNFSKWRKSILKDNSLLAVCQLPDELFQPYSSTTTSIIFMEKGIPHNPKTNTVFVRISKDGFILKKSTRVFSPDNQLPLALDSIINKINIPGFSGAVPLKIGEEWSPGAYIPSNIPLENELKQNIDVLIRRLASFYIRYATEVTTLRTRIQKNTLISSPYRSIISKAKITNSQMIKAFPNTIGSYFDIYYGQKELHSREKYSRGDSLIISPTEQYNGCYDWLDFENLIDPPFITVAQTGTIGEAFVQLESCGVNDDCLILLPKEDIPIPLYFIAAATIRLERWRFNYGRKLTPSRIAEFPLTRNNALEQWTQTLFSKWLITIDTGLSIYESKQ